MELKDITSEAAAATDSVATRMGFTAQFSAFGYHPVSHSSMDTDFAQEEGAITEFVRSRDLLIAKAQEAVMKMRTNARLEEMINGSLMQRGAVRGRRKGGVSFFGTTEGGVYRAKMDLSA